MHGEENNDDTTQKMTDFLGDGTCLAGNQHQSCSFRHEGRSEQLQHVSATRVSVLRQNNGTQKNRKSKH